jgi:ParE toxin of type II toxin-antitoxin system, parDE
MIQYVLHFLPQSIADILEIKDWYFDQRPGLEIEFLKSFEEAVSKLKANPLHFAIRYRNARFKLLNRFPYRIVFRLIGDDIVIYGVIHIKRGPKLIRKRLK